MNRLLSKEHRKAGLHLEEDDHGVTLYHDENVIAHFGIHATVENIIHEADQWLNMQKAGICFERRQCVDCQRSHDDCPDCIEGNLYKSPDQPEVK